MGSRYCSKCAVAARERWEAKYPCLGMTKRQKFARQSKAAKKAVAVRRERHPHRFVPLDAERFWQQKAMAMVASAKRHGILPRLDGSIACVDCGGPACVYEHRDYSRPLDVEPVCATCNSYRGTATWPTADQFNFPKVAAA